MMFYCLKTVEICDTWLSTVVHFLYSILLRLMKSRQKRVWTFCRTLLNITMHNASKCCNALSFSYCFLFFTRFCFPLFQCIRAFFMTVLCQASESSSSSFQERVCEWVWGAGQWWRERLKENLASCMQKIILFPEA